MSFFIPSYRRESNTEGPFPGEPDRSWTLHVVAWLGLEFVLKVPREPYGYKTAGASSPNGFRTPEYQKICDECASRFSKGGIA